MDNIIKYKLVTKSSEDGPYTVCNTINDTENSLFNTVEKILDVVNNNSNLSNQYLVSLDPLDHQYKEDNPLIFEILKAVIKNGIILNPEIWKKFDLNQKYKFTCQEECTPLTYILFHIWEAIHHIKNRDLVLEQLLENGVDLSNPNHNMKYYDRGVISSNSNHIIFYILELSDTSTHHLNCQQKESLDPTFFDIGPLKLFMKYIKTDITKIIGTFSDIEGKVNPIEYVKYLYTEPMHSNSAIYIDDDLWKKAKDYRKQIIDILSGNQLGY